MRFRLLVQGINSTSKRLCKFQPSQFRKVHTMSAAPTQGEKLVAFYGKQTAASYSDMMVEEMKKSEGDLNELLKIVSDVPGPIVDLCCGSGHMLAFLKKAEASRGLIGQDLSPDMVEVARGIAPGVEFEVGNMLDVGKYKEEECAAILNCFAVHHVSEAEAAKAITEYAKILKKGGCLYLAAWEGNQPIDYGGMAFDALMHSKETMLNWIGQAGLCVASSREVFEPEMGMNTFYVLARK